jgi:hypothetical protein
VARSLLSARHKELPAELFERGVPKVLPTSGVAGWTLKEAREAFERRYLLQVLDQTEGNLSRAAQILGIHRNTVMVKLEELGIREDAAALGKRKRSAVGDSAAGDSAVGGSTEAADDELPDEPLPADPTSTDPTPLS